jgi:type IV pilus assembly protein PilC
MLFAARLPLSSLIELCRVSRHYLGSGLTLLDVFRQQAQRGPARVRPVAQRITAVLEAGDGLQQALKRESAVFPPLFLSLVGVGEQTGMLPEVFGELERYYLRQQKLRQQFLSRIAWPVVQFVLAVFVLAGLIWAMGIVANRSGVGGKPFDPLGLGLFGTSGALIFLSVVWGSLLGVAGLYILLTRSLRQRAAVDRLLLRVPALGPCLRALALGRFCLALRLTTETGMPIARAVRLALRATGNAAYAAASPVAESGVGAGDELTAALARTGLFPEDFQNILAVAEESGRLHEVLRQQAEHYHEESSRRLAVLTSVAGYGVWAFVGLCIIVAIFRIFGSYLSLLDSV